MSLVAAWVRINRFPSIANALEPHFDTAGPSTAAPFTSTHWSSLASFGAKRRPGTTRYYSMSGNSVVAIVRSGACEQAMAVMAGGQSGNVASPHFADRIGRYATGQLRPVHSYSDELAGHVEYEYRQRD